jgi:hypothetical protein
VVIIQGCAPSQPVEISPTDTQLLSVEAYGLAMADCLRGKGWDAEADPDLGVTATYLENEAPRFIEDFEACSRQVGLPADPIALSERQWDDLYRDYVNTIACLENLGVSMPSPVSESTFRGDGLGTHFAYKHLPPEFLPRLAELQAECPQPEVR